MRYDLQDGDGLRVQRTRPGQRGWTTAEHQRPVVRPVAARQRGATSRCRREGRRPEGRSYLGSVSRRIGPFHPRSRSAPLGEPSGSHDSDGRLDENAMRSHATPIMRMFYAKVRWNSNRSNSQLEPEESDARLVCRVGLDAFRSIREY